MAKTVEQMDERELRERLLELDLAEMRCWEEAATIRFQKAQVNLSLYRIENKEKVK